MIRCVIVEDEFPAREELKYFINNFEWCRTGKRV